MGPCSQYAAVDLPRRDLFNRVLHANGHGRHGDMMFRGFRDAEPLTRFAWPKAGVGGTQRRKLVLMHMVALDGRPDIAMIFDDGSLWVYRPPLDRTTLIYELREQMIARMPSLAGVFGDCPPPIGARCRCIASLDVSDALSCQLFSNGLVILRNVLLFGVPSVAIFRIDERWTLEFRYAEPMLSLSDVSYAVGWGKFLFVPRLGTGFVASADLAAAASGSDTGLRLPARVLPRFLGDLGLVGAAVPTRQTRVRAACGSGRSVVTWNDAVEPSVILWTVPEDGSGWTALELTFRCSAHLRAVCADRSEVQRVGLVVVTELGTMVCEWDVAGTVVQRNFALPGDFEYVMAEFAQSAHGEMVRLCVDSGLVRVEHWGDRLVRGEFGRFARVTGGFFMQRDDSFVRVRRLPDFQPIEGGPLPPFELSVQARSGAVGALRALHMRRCATCRRPLLCTIVGGLGDLAESFCSPHCQAANAQAPADRDGRD